MYGKRLLFTLLVELEVDMATIFPGRYTAKTDEPFVIFMIGMRVNKLWAINKWLPTFMAMVPMLSTLYKHPEKGFLGGYTTIGSQGPVLVQYWRSFQDLEAFAHSPSDPHLPAWRAFGKAIHGDGSVGIWHETYQVQPGAFETVYSGMPRFGLASVMEHVPVTARTNSARERLKAETPEPAQAGPVR
jgi:hypothetical protein